MDFRVFSRNYLKTEILKINPMDTNESDPAYRTPKKKDGIFDGIVAYVVL